MYTRVCTSAAPVIAFLSHSLNLLSVPPILVLVHLYSAAHCSSIDANPILHCSIRLARRSPPQRSPRRIRPRARAARDARREGALPAVDSRAGASQSRSASQPQPASQSASQGRAAPRRAQEPQPGGKEGLPSTSRSVDSPLHCAACYSHSQCSSLHANATSYIQGG